MHNIETLVTEVNDLYVFFFNYEVIAHSNLFNVLKILFNFTASGSDRSAFGQEIYFQSLLQLYWLQKQQFAYTALAQFLLASS